MSRLNEIKAAMEAAEKAAVEYKANNYRFVPVLNQRPGLLLVPFRDCWDKLNAKHGYGWDANPWVRVISFERVSKEEVPT